ncbi:hypothetical protein COU53_01470 [Candidatus Pacearchaeota archaeon CG10_big_fil_rev_8_21_14_0_10_30_48]|nr:MAG: hypothetical protein COU53_01470 [Candidatus Pacearchaeota archaeon CG10_big_fil_rev_8_21_14_0_10_30_48]
MKNNPISIKIPEEMLEKIKSEAEKTERSRLAIIRLALKKYFERNKNE